MIDLIKGADFPLTITLKDAEGTAININNLLNLQVAVFQKREYVLQSWDLANGIEVVIASEGQVRVIIDRANTTGRPERPMSIEVIYTTADVLGQDGEIRIAAPAKQFANVINSALSD